MRDRSTTIVGQLCSFAILIRPARANLPGRLIEGAGTAPLPVITSAALRDTQDVNVLGTKIGCAFALRSGYRCAKRSKLHDGRVAEWFKAPVLKTGVPARVPWVRIPPLPPVKPKRPSIFNIWAVWLTNCDSPARELREAITRSVGTPFRVTIR